MRVTKIVNYYYYYYLWFWWCCIPEATGSKILPWMHNQAPPPHAPPTSNASPTKRMVTPHPHATANHMPRFPGHHPMQTHSQHTSNPLMTYINPILTGHFVSKFWLINLTPLQISAPKGPIAAKFCLDVKTHVKSCTATTFFRRKMVYLLCYYDLCKSDAQLSHIY